MRSINTRVLFMKKLLGPSSKQHALRRAASQEAGNDQRVCDPQRSPVATEISSRNAKRISSSKGERKKKNLGSFFDKSHQVKRTKTSNPKTYMGLSQKDSTSQLTSDQFSTSPVSGLVLQSRHHATRPIPSDFLTPDPEPNTLLSSPDVSCDREAVKKCLRNEEDHRKKPFLLQSTGKSQSNQSSINVHHVKTQMTVWSSLLASRIHLQRLLTPMAQMPVPLPRSDPVLMSKVNTEIASLLVQCRHLQRSLLKRNAKVLKCLNSQTLRPYVKTGIMDSNPIYANRLQQRTHWVESDPQHQKENQCWTFISTLPKKVTQWCFDVADLWHTKALVRTSRALKVLDQPPSRAVQRILNSQLEKLLKKVLVTQPLDANMSSCEYYDDTDVYVTLLRSTLGTNMTITGSLAEESVAAQAFKRKIQQQERLKHNQQIERRGSKGRKIRYVAIPKLLGFMTPEPNFFSKAGLYAAEESAEQKTRLVDLLISSLFKKDERKMDVVTC